MIAKYPIVWLLYRVFGVLVSGDKPIWWNSIHQSWNKKDFYKNHDGYMAAAMKFSRHNLRGLSNTARAYLPTHELQIEPERRVDNYIDRMVEYITAPYLDDEAKLERLRTFNKFVDFFHDCYVTMNNILLNVSPLFSFIPFYISKWLVDDIAGVICQGSTEFKNCDFGKYPGFNEADIISEDEIKSMVYKYEE